MRELTPREIVAELDRHIIGQNDAKRAVAVALRNRWRWQQLPDEMRREVTPKNILMIGPTGVGKTEITRRLADLTGAPFVKVEATKYTEVGYYGRDVESIIRDLVESSLNMVRDRKRKDVEPEAQQRTEERLLDLLLHTQDSDAEDEPDVGLEAETDIETHERAERHARTREKFREMLRAGKLDDRSIELNVEQRQSPVQVFSNMGIEQMDLDMQNMLERIVPKKRHTRELKVAQARDVIFDQEVEALIDQDALQEDAIRLAEDSGVVFIDEIDKVCGSEEGRSADVSRQGVQRDLLPIVEGTTVQTKYGYLKTDNILFIAAGAFHRARPADMMPELQGRFPIRVELSELTRDDFVRILTEPNGAITKQHQALLSVEGITLTFQPDAIDALADIAFEVNQSTQNIGARRLHTILERLLEEISFDAPELKKKSISIDAAFVRERLEEISSSEDLSQFIL
ncbi:ATP-dependent protease ATPase subunit HslU [bacterium]|nr:ATP-dependent protease ATPase subunit HslU [bacterium]